MAELDALRAITPGAQTRTSTDPVLRNELNRERLTRQMGGGTSAARTVLAALGNRRQASNATLLSAGGS